MHILLVHHLAYSYLTVKEVLGPTTDFPTWGSGKGTENPQGI